jgi:hypothetical protein
MTNVIQIAWVANHFGALKSGQTTPARRCAQRPSWVMPILPLYHLTGS